MSVESQSWDWREFSNQQALVNELADTVVAQISRAIDERGQAIIALSGGSTPKPLFIELASRDVDWARVIVTLVDERWVNESHELSNAAFMKTHLLDLLPTAATFVPLYQAAAAVSESLPGVLAAYCQITGSIESNPAKPDLVILGMGGDGHTASFFPDAGNIAQLVDPEQPQVLLTCDSPTTQVSRVTWSLPWLLSADYLALHFTGIGKRAVFEQAANGSDACELPIRSAIHQTRSPLHVFYAD